MKRNTPVPDSVALRERAETRSRGRAAPDDLSQSAFETKKLVHELHVHQIELELQNEELRAAQGAAEEALARYSELYDFAPVGYFTLYHRGEIAKTNLAGALMLGAERDRLIGFRLGGFVTPAALPMFNAFLQQVFTIGAPLSCEVELSINGAESRPVLITATRSSCESECRVVVVDITARKQSEMALLAAKQEAERADRAKSEFLSCMSHELRTPMNAILGFAQLLNGDKKLPLAPKHKAFVQQILHAGDQLLHLISEVLDLAQVESGHMNFVLEGVALVPLLHDCEEMMSPLIAEGQLEVAVESLDAANDGVLADSHRLRQVILNLLSNAVKYNRPGGRIMVRCAPASPGWVRVSVQDTGQGISATDLPRLFTNFERLEVDRNRVGGTGIGLALCKKLIEEMGGRIGVDSTPSIGSTFWFELAATVQPPRAGVTAPSLATPVLTSTEEY